VRRLRQEPAGASGQIVRRLLLHATQ
jgi:hypothetical protein